MVISSPFRDELPGEFSVVPDGSGEECGAGAVARALLGPVADDEGGVRVVLGQAGVDTGLFGAPGAPGGAQRAS
ncbi:hypothetical protein ACQEV4_17530 [Streptomyces shenzhenensis]|uniref:hypothetical protein n=1 Tax=Streptomyces shenzhenensis TaxID=943815 RepID=UPI003D8EB4B9